HLGVDWKVFDGVRIGCIGTTTAARVRDFGGNVSLVPPKFQAESLVEALLSEEVDGKKVLLPRAQGSRELLPRELRHNGAIVNEIHIYSAKLPESGRAELVDILKEQTLDFITFTSSSTVHNFVEMAGDLITHLDPNRTRLAVIGPITAATLEEYGLHAAIRASEFTIPGLVQALIEYRQQNHS